VILDKLEIVKKDLDKEEKVGIIERVEKLKVRWSRG